MGRRKRLPHQDTKHQPAIVGALVRQAFSPPRVTAAPVGLLHGDSLLVQIITGGMFWFAVALAGRGPAFERVQPPGKAAAGKECPPDTVLSWSEETPWEVPWTDRVVVAS